MALSPAPRISKRPSPRWRRRKEARPAEIAQAALATFVERGYAATKLEAIARRAGISKGTMYLYFPSKEALFRAVVEQSMVPTVERGEAIEASFRGSSLDLLRAILLDWWDAIEGSSLPGLTKLMMSESGNFPDEARFFLNRVVRRRRALLARVLQRGIKRGEFRADLPLPLAVRLAVAPVLLASIWAHSFQRRERRDGTDYRELVRLHTEIFLHGIERRR
jgi:AcrR family transcriptional regulator